MISGHFVVAIYKETLKELKYFKRDLISGHILFRCEQFSSSGVKSPIYLPKHWAIRAASVPSMGSHKRATTG